MKEETGAICWDGALLHKALHRHFQIGPSHELWWRAHSAGCWMSPLQGLSVKPTLVYFVPGFPQSMCSEAAKCPSWCELKKFCFKLHYCSFPSQVLTVSLEVAGVDSETLKASAGKSETTDTHSPLCLWSAGSDCQRGLYTQTGCKG